MKLLKFVQVLLVLLSVSAPAMANGVGAGGGGGVIKKNGNYISFYKSGVRIPITTVLQAEIPELDDLEANMNSIFMDGDLRDQLVLATRPSASRHYYRADSSQLSPTDRAHIIAEYRAAIHAPVSQKLEIAAITTPEGDTFLFSPYFALQNKNSREAILLHEAVWTLPNAQLNYPNVIRIETEFEACLDQPIYKDGLRVCEGLNLAVLETNVTTHGKLIDGISYAFREDLFQGRINWLLDGNSSKVSLKTLFGKDTFNYEFVTIYNSEAQRRLAVIHQINQLAIDHPDSKLIALLKPYASNLHLAGWAYDDYSSVGKIYANAPLREFNNDHATIDFTNQTTSVQTGFSGWKIQAPGSVLRAELELN